MQRKTLQKDTHREGGNIKSGRPIGMLDDGMKGELKMLNNGKSKIVQKEMMCNEFVRKSVAFNEQYLRSLISGRLSSKSE